MTRFEQLCPLKALIAAAAVAVVGCNSHTDPAPTASQPSNRAVVPEGLALATNESSVPGRANPKLQTLRLFIGPHVLDTELALTDTQIRTGMMFRQNIEENEAMLFVFPFPHRAGFWMKNVEIPLDGAYIDPEGQILEIVDMKPHDETTLHARTDRVQYVLETRHGWFERNGIGPGTLITTELGTLRETFSRRPGL